MQTVDIASMEVADTNGYAGQNSVRLDSPTFIFGNKPQGNRGWARETALDFEEWVERQNHREQYLKGEVIPGFIIRQKIAIENNSTLEEAKPSDLVIGQQPNKRQRKERRFAWTARKQPKWEWTSELVAATMSEVEEWLKSPTKDKQPVSLIQDEEGNLHEWKPADEAETLAFFERQASREYANWLIRFHKRRPANNDHWREFVRPFLKVLDAGDERQEIAEVVLKTLKNTLPFAQGPVKEMVYIEPPKAGQKRGRRVQAKAKNIGAAMKGFKERHQLNEELVTMDRVQYEGEKHSTWVIGTRKDSSMTPSSYVDKNPLKDETGYIPTNGSTLVKVDSNYILKEGEYRLTIREFERSLLMGANIEEDEWETLACQVDQSNFNHDIREAGLSFDNECNFRMIESLSESESWLYWTLWGAGLEAACQTMLTASDNLDIQRYLPGLAGAFEAIEMDRYTTDEEEEALDIIRRAEQHDAMDDDDWSAVAFLRNLAMAASKQVECHIYRNMVNDYFEINPDVCNNNTVSDTGFLRYEGKQKRPAYLSW